MQRYGNQVSGTVDAFLRARYSSICRNLASGYRLPATFFKKEILSQMFL